MFFSSLVINGKQESQNIEVNPVNIEKQTPFKIQEPAPVKLNVTNAFYTGYTPFVNPANKQVGVPECKTEKKPEQHEVPTRSRREFMAFSNS